MDDFVEHKFGDLTVSIDRATCIGSANCMAVADSIFVFDDDQICAFTDPAPDARREMLIEACQVCPVDALIVTDRDGKQIVP